MNLLVATVSILPVPNDAGGQSYQAFSGDRHSQGRTPGEALDAITAQFEGVQASTLVVLQNHIPDQFFTADQSGRVEELMRRWRAARDSGESLSPKEQLELDGLVEAELRAAGQRAASMADELAK